jgi:GNAT superfamily N-acetyltransferase
MLPNRLDRCDSCNAVLIPRTLEQNDKYHAVVQDIADQRDWPKGSGQMLSVEVWKQLISAAFERAQGRGTGVYPAIDGHGVDVVYWHSSRRGKKAMSELIEYAQAWAIDEGLTLHDPVNAPAHE